MRNLAHDAPYIDINPQFLFRIQVTGAHWGALGLTIPTDASDFGIDLFSEAGVLLASTGNYWSCGAGAAASPNKTGFISIDGSEYPAGTVFLAVIRTGGKQYTVEWYEATQLIPFSVGASCSAAEWACASFPTGHVAHAYDFEMEAGNNYALYHSSTCGCPGTTQLQSFQFVTDNGSFRGSFGSSGNYLSISPVCSSCGSTQVGISADSAANSTHGVVAIDTTGQTHAAVNICYRAEARSCAAPLSLCRPVCTDTSTDSKHCGSGCIDCSAAVANASGSVCSASSCDYAACNSGFSDCDGNRSNGCETNLATKCVNPNASGLFCANNACDYVACNAGFVDCDGNRVNGCETNLALRCTNMNATGLSCAANACDYAACDPGHWDCDGNRANGCEHAGTSCPAGALATGQEATNLAVNRTSVLWTNYNSLRAALSVPIDGGPVAVLAFGSGNAYGIAADDNAAYVSHDNGTTVTAFALDGGAPRTLATGQVHPYNVAVDSSFVYWVTYDGSTVMKVPISGGTPVTLASGQNFPLGIAVDGTFVYWTTFMGGTVMKVPISGGTPVTLASAQAGPRRIAVDSTSVYWTTSTAVMKVAIGGGSPVVVSPGAANAVAVDGISVYWSSGAGVKKLPIAGGSEVLVSAGAADALAVDGTYVYFNSGGNIMKVLK